MIWYICAVASLLLMVSAVKSALNKKYGIARVGFVLSKLAIATFVIYIPIFFELYNVVTAVFSDIINIFQVISLDADYTAFYDMVTEEIASPLFAKSYMALIGLLHFLMPTVSLIAVYNIFMLCYSSIQMFFVNIHKKDLYVFTEQNQHSLSLAKDVSTNIGKCDILFLNCPPNDQNEGISKDKRYIFHQSTLKKIHIENKKNKNTYFFCCSNNESKNLDDALYLIMQYSALDKERQKDIHIFLFTEQPNTDVMIDSTQKGFLDIKIISRSETAAYKLISDYPLYDYAKDGIISVLLYGFGRINENLLKASLWCGTLEKYTLKINVVGVNISDEVDNFLNSCPDLKDNKFNLHFYNCKSLCEAESTIKELCTDSTYIVVNLQNEQQTIDESLNLRRIFYSADPSFSNNPPIFLYIENSEKSKMVSSLKTSELNPKKRVSYNFIPFGETSTIDTYGNLVASDLDFLSKRIHMEYEDIFSENGINVSEALERYNLLEVNKRSNRASAMHIRYKLALLGLDYTDNLNCEEVDFSQYITNSNLEALMRMEHQRWMIFLQTEGWSSASIEEVKAYKASGLSAGRHNCPILKKHPYICDFDVLQKRSDELGLPDSTLYDKELILRIPYILHDRWGVSGKKYKIIKKDVEE